MNISAVTGYLRRHVWGAVAASGLLSGAVSAVATAAFSDYTNFRSAYRSLVQADYEKARAVQLDMDSALQKFADRANGKGNTTAADVETLEKAVKSEYADAEQLTMRIQSLQPEFNALAEGLIALQKAAIAFKGPADAKEFVRSVAQYYSARDAFIEAAAKAQGRWLALN